MLSFLAPGYLVAALAAAAGLIAAHFIVRRLPRALVLPTARFVPDAPVLTTGWARVPSDLLPLILRVLCVLLAGLALAGPYLRGGGAGTARVILADRSRAVADSSEVTDSVNAVRASDDVVIDYSSTAVEAASAQPGAGSPSARRASLSAGLVAATRAASRFRDAADSVELVIVSSFAAEELDAATARVRQAWPGRARLVRVSARAAADSSRAPALVTEGADPLAVALAAARATTSADVRLVRGEIAGADSTWVTSGDGRVLVHWPVTAAPAGFIARARNAPAVGLVGDGEALIARLPRRWQYVPALESEPVAWWIDGDVAAAESALGGGCVRGVAVPVSSVGDFVLRPDFHAILRELVEPCGGAPAYAPMREASLATLAGAGALAPSSAFAQPRAEASSLTTWLLLAALACALLELLVRGRRAAAAPAGLRGTGGTAPERKVA